MALTSPKNACTKVAPAPNITGAGYQWIALIPRTNASDVCDFDLKASLPTRGLCGRELRGSVGIERAEGEFQRGDYLQL